MARSVSYDDHLRMISRLAVRGCRYIGPHDYLKLWATRCHRPTSVHGYRAGPIALRVIRRYRPVCLHIRQRRSVPLQNRPGRCLNAPPARVAVVSEPLRSAAPAMFYHQIFPFTTIPMAIVTLLLALTLGAVGPVYLLILMRTLYRSSVVVSTNGIVLNNRSTFGVWGCRDRAAARVCAFSSSR